MPYWRQTSSAPPDAGREARPPRASYRLQLRPGWGLQDAAALVPYLDQLGISHLYSSPLFAARPGSPHGYDVISPDLLNPELGTEHDLAHLAGALHAHGMSLLLDIVPNHMAATPENPWWWSVLAHGLASPQAHWFDVDWRARRAHPGRPEQVVLPVLGQSVNAALARGELHVDRTFPAPRLRYGEQWLPLEGPEQPTLRAWLERQHYRLTAWRTARQEINYRRFFAVNELVGFRVEVPEAFAASHARIRRWLQAGWVQALRVDHVDGLLDPGAYLERLRGLFPAGAPPEIWVEKILAEGETLPPEWPVQGATGYEFLADLDRLQIPAAGNDALLRHYRRFIRREADFASVVYGKKREMIHTLFEGEMRGLAVRAAALASAAHRAAEESAVFRALCAIAACFPVYRTYARGLSMPPAQRAAVDAAVAQAGRREPGLDTALLAWLGELLGAGAKAGVPPSRAADWLRFLQRWQQYTAPIMAKGQEDAAFYVFVPLVSRNEVGANPAAPPLSAAGWHQRMVTRRRTLPHGLNATSTHDTKRGEDVRARLNVLAEIPERWQALTRRWARWNAPHRGTVRRRPAPTRNDEYLLYQTLVGAWPMAGEPEAEFVTRVRGYMRKATREANIETAWARPDAEYEAALDRFIAATLDPAAAPLFLDSLRRFAAHLAPAGALNSLVQLTLKALAPGVPDFYQGTERWHLALVDPDNRRPVDFATPAAWLREWATAAPDPHILLDHWPNGAIKLWLTQRLLALRRRHPELFLEGEYIPVPLVGGQAAHALAFVRQRGNESLLVVAPLAVAAASLGHAPRLDRWHWDGTRLALPPGLRLHWTNCLATGGRFDPALSLLLASFPVAVWGAGGAA